MPRGEDLDVFACGGLLLSIVWAGEVAATLRWAAGEEVPEPTIVGSDVVAG